MAQASNLLKDDLCVEKSYCQYAIALGTISTIAALAMAGMIFTNKMTTDIKKGFCTFLFLWNGVGVGVTTFGRPFDAMGNTPNGYFGVWVGALVSATLFASVFAPTKIDEKTKEMREKIREAWSKFQESTMLILLVIGSAVSLIVGAIQCGDADIECTGIVAFGVAFGAINTIVAGGLFYLAKREPFQYSNTPQLVFMGLGIWWVCGFLALTLKQNRFALLGNGYLSILVGAIAAVNIAAAAAKKSAHNTPDYEEQANGQGSVENEADKYNVDNNA